MRWVSFVFFLFCAAPLSAAEGCADVWFTRNLIMDRAGYCFGSPLGQALFDNSDCTGQHVQLDPTSQALVQRIRGLEAQHGCQVNTNAQWLEIDDIAFRRVVRDLPLRVDGQWGCLGWAAAETPLYDGHSAPLHAIGKVLPGDYVLFEHEGVADAWVYVTIHEPVWGPFKSAGWLYWPGRTPCLEEAG